MNPHRLALTYWLDDKCGLLIDLMRSTNGKRLVKLNIELCSQPIEVSDACVEKFVEPNFGAYAVLFNDLTAFDGVPNPYVITLTVPTRMESARKSGDAAPPFVRMKFDGSGVSECDEILEIE